MTAKNKGFTLVEVLVAIIIVMILATYSVLKYTETIYEGENKKAKAQMEVIAGAYKTYLMEHPEEPLSGQVTYDATNKKCMASKAAEGGGTASFYCGKPDIAESKYIFTLGAPAETPSCGASLVTMTSKSGEKVGENYGSGYCAYIDRFGGAKDGVVSGS